MSCIYIIYKNKKKIRTNSDIFKKKIFMQTFNFNISNFLFVKAGIDLCYFNLAYLR